MTVVRLDPGTDPVSGRRWIICHNPVEADRDAAPFCGMFSMTRKDA